MAPIPLSLYFFSQREASPVVVSKRTLSKQKKQQQPVATTAARFPSPSLPSASSRDEAAFFQGLVKPLRTEDMHMVTLQPLVILPVVVAEEEDKSEEAEAQPSNEEGPVSLVRPSLQEDITDALPPALASEITLSTISEAPELEWSTGGGGEGEELMKLSTTTSTSRRRRSQTAGRGRGKLRVFGEKTRSSGRLIGRKVRQQLEDMSFESEQPLPGDDELIPPHALSPYTATSPLTQEPSRLSPHSSQFPPPSTVRYRDPILPRRRHVPPSEATRYIASSDLSSLDSASEEEQRPKRSHKKKTTTGSGGGGRKRRKTTTTTTTVKVKEEVLSEDDDEQQVPVRREDRHENRRYNALIRGPRGKFARQGGSNDHAYHSHERSTSQPQASTSSSSWQGSSVRRNRPRACSSLSSSTIDSNHTSDSTSTTSHLVTPPPIAQESQQRSPRIVEDGEDAEAHDDDEKMGGLQTFKTWDSLTDEAAGPSFSEGGGVEEGSITTEDSAA